MDDLSDAALAQQARAGNQAAFVALVERHTPLLRHIARRMVGHPDLTDDLVQEAVVQAYLALPHLRDAGIGTNQHH
jgi:RNA polymerase sigma-70 factor (ECF subfamily)